MTPPTTLPEGETKRVMIESMFDSIAPTYDRLNRVISLGLDRGWRRKTIAALELDPAAHVIDLACGTGDLCEDLARAGFRAFGFDISAYACRKLIGSYNLGLRVRSALVGGQVSRSAHAAAALKTRRDSGNAGGCSRAVGQTR